MLDPEITLFGRRIQLKGEGEGEIGVDEESPRSVEKITSDDHHEVEIDKEVMEEESMENDQHDDSLAEVMDESTYEPGMSETADKIEKATGSEKDFESQQGEKESNDPQQKVLKKPDKILPCPRCNSMDTKFCYYNNYNVNQPRHFCKSCQRYWTAGGTMRNVPVGAGRRKNKSSASRYCHITVSEALQAARFDVANGANHPGLKTNGTVLTFGSDNQLYEPVTSVLNIADKTAVNGTPRNGFPTRVMDNRDDSLSGSSVTTSSIEAGLKKSAQEPKPLINGFANQMPCLPMPYMWNPAVPVPSPFFPAVFPMPIYPHPNWNGAPIPMNVPWVVPQYSPTQNSPVSNPNSSTLGKHTRDGEMVTPSDNDRSSGTNTVLMPKTLRIDNPDEAAKSSIWSTLGIKKDKGDSLSKGFFNSFQSKEADKKDGESEAPPAFIKANPVALCRSLNFQERA